MPKHDDRHLTTTQLSALIDKQLSEQELATCHAHLQSCQQCQSALAGLQQTVALLQALPEPALPRSFTLPAGITYLQERPARQDQEEQQAATNPPVRRRLWPYYVQRSLGAASAIVAVLGLVFLLSGLLPMLPQAAGPPVTTSAPAASSEQRSSAGSGTSHAATATAQKSLAADHHGITVQTPIATPQPANTPVAATPTAGISRSQQKPSTNTSARPLLPLADVGTPVQRQEAGFILLVLGIVGVLVTRRKSRKREDRH